MKQKLVVAAAAGWVYPVLLRTTPTEVPTPGVGRGNATQGAAAAPRD